MTEWYEKDSFWNELSDKLFTQEHWARAEAEINSIINLLGIQQGNRVLDLCCGPGRHSVELAKRGFVVTALDRTPSYLQNVKELALKNDLDIECVLEDMRRLRRPDSFDIVLNLYTSFGFFSDRNDDKLVLDNVFSSLKQGGRLLIDMMGKEILARVFQERSWSENNGVIYLEERKVEDGWEMIRDKWSIIQDGRKREYTFRHRLYSGVELSSLLRDVGFESVKVFGDLKGNPYDNTAKRLVAVATK